jgi:hypothetical protein
MRQVPEWQSGEMRQPPVALLVGEGFGSSALVPQKCIRLGRRICKWLCLVLGTLWPVHFIIGQATMMFAGTMPLDNMGSPR